MNPNFEKWLYSIPDEDRLSLVRAYNFARAKHEGQFDDCGKPYFTAHVMQVVDILLRVTNDKDIIVAALLHDLVEDTDVTLQDIASKFNGDIANLVKELTKEGKKDEYGYYFSHLKSEKAILIKFADRLSNISRMESWDEDRRNQYLRKSVFWKDGSNKPQS